MPFLPNTLAAGLSAMVPVKTEIEGINNFCNAYLNYWVGAQVMGVPANPGTLQAPKAAMVGQLVGWGQANTSAAKIQAAMISFWSQVTSLAPALWIVPPATVTPSVIPPAGLSGLAASLQGVFQSNTSAGLPLASACQQIALAIHTAHVGGIVTVLIPSVPTPIPTPTPIL